MRNKFEEYTFMTSDDKVIVIKDVSLYSAKKRFKRMTEKELVSSSEENFNG